jgi:hypothetical protein
MNKKYSQNKETPWKRKSIISLLFSPSLILMFSLFSKEKEGDRRNKRKEKK